MPTDYTTALGQLRLLIADVDPDATVLTDEHVTGYLTLHGITNPHAQGTDLVGVRRAAADALDAIATSEALIAKVIRSQDLATDGPKTAAALRTHAQSLRSQADADEDTAAGGLFVVEFSPFAARGAGEAAEAGA